MNPYFQSGDGIGNRSEQRLFEDLIIEGLKIYGNLIYYIPDVVIVIIGVSQAIILFY
jgi:hypothetical protein